VFTDVSNLVQEMRRAWGEPFPWVFTVECQKKRSEEIGIEVFNGMIATPSLPRRVFDRTIEAWPYGGGGGYGGVDITPFSDRGGGGARSLAGYLAKYLGKELHLAAPGEQSYRVAQGFQPRREQVNLPDSHNSAIEAAKAWSRVQPFDLEAFYDLREASRPMDAVWLAWRAA
jgi:hypothetical protein